MNGKFTDAQRDLYTAVLNVERTCVSLCRESANLSLDGIHEIAEKNLREQLDLLGFDTSGQVHTSFRLAFLEYRADDHLTGRHADAFSPSCWSLHRT